MRLTRNRATVSKVFSDWGFSALRKAGNLKFVARRAGILFGSPSRIREEMQRLVSVSGRNYVICSFAWGTLSPEQSMRSLRLFADEVMPAVVAA